MRLFASGCAVVAASLGLVGTASAANSAGVIRAARVGSEFVGAYRSGLLRSADCEYAASVLSCDTEAFARTISRGRELAAVLRTIRRDAQPHQCQQRLRFLQTATSYVLADIPRMIQYRAAAYELSRGVVRRATDSRISEIALTIARLRRICR
jgi:hypothetical protein